MIVRHIVEISEDDVMTYHFYYVSRATTLNSANTKLVTLAPGLRPEWRFASLARGIMQSVRKKEICSICYTRNYKEVFSESVLNPPVRCA